MTPEKPLSGLRVLVPRGGSWGTLVSDAIRARGATPVVAPLVDFASTSDVEGLKAALARLAAGEFDWMTATSATVVDVLAHQNATIPESTKVAVVGDTTAAAFEAAGYTVERMPLGLENTAHALLEEWPEINEDKKLSVLTLRSNIATPVLTGGLIERGHDVTPVVAFRVVGVPAPKRVLEDVESGRINAILVTSATVAEQVRKQFSNIPATTLLACTDAQTRAHAESLGLKIGAVSGDTSLDALLESISDRIDTHAEND